MTYVSKNELNYLLSVLEECKENETQEVDNAIVMVRGFIEEGDKVDDLSLEQVLDNNNKIVGVVNEEA